MSRHQVLNPATPSQLPSRLCALGIMTKAPQAGKVKTRLTPPLTPEEAAELNVCFLRDLGRSIAVASMESPALGIGIYTPVGAEKVYEDVLPEGFFLIPQRGVRFGERLTFAAEDLFKVGFESVCLINSDSPTVPASNFTQAVKELAKSGDRIVLGPSDDGGYYLIGLGQMHRWLFEEIDWSTKRVLTQTIDRAAEIGVHVRLLPHGFDVDDRTTLHRLCDELLGEGGSVSNDVAATTREFLQEIIAREGRGRIWPML
jgi:rSAM/selenodomain-associated transferase 1